jgi:urocanate hydratase
VDEITDDADKAIDLALEWQQKNKAHSIAFLGNIVDLWERLAEKKY